MNRLTQSLLLFFSPEPLQGYFISDQIHIAKEELLAQGLSKWHQPSLLSCKAALVDTRGEIKSNFKKYAGYAMELEYRLAIENWARINSNPTHYGLEELYKNLRSLFNKSSLSSEKLLKALYPVFKDTFDEIMDEDQHSSCNQMFTDLTIRALQDG